MIDWQRLREVLAAIRRRWKLIGVLFAVYMVLFTEINLNPDIETYMTPLVTDEQAMAAADVGDWETVIRFTVQGAVKGEVDAQSLLADFYDRGLPPLHVDHCRAFDWYVKAGQNGDLRSQDEVAVRLVNTYGGYKDIEGGYLWAAHALKGGYEPALGTISVYYARRISASRRGELDRLLIDWSPAKDRFQKLYRLPILPFISKWIFNLYPSRFCRDPKVYQHILRAFGYR